MSDLQDKTIINVNNGKNLGYITDLEINEEGNILSFYAMPKRMIFRLFSSNKESIFTIKDIKKIGEDVILVELN